MFLFAQTKFKAKPWRGTTMLIPPQLPPNLGVSRPRDISIISLERVVPTHTQRTFPQQLSSIDVFLSLLDMFCCFIYIIWVSVDRGYGHIWDRPIWYGAYLSPVCTLGSVWGCIWSRLVWVRVWHLWQATPDGAGHSQQCSSLLLWSRQQTSAPPATTWHKHTNIVIRIGPEVSPANKSRVMVNVQMTLEGEQYKRSWMVTGK